MSIFVDKGLNLINCLSFFHSLRDYTEIPSSINKRYVPIFIQIVNQSTILDIVNVTSQASFVMCALEQFIKEGPDEQGCYSLVARK